MNNKLGAVYPTAFTPMPSSPVTMTEAWNHSINAPRINGTRGGQREGHFASVRSLAALAVVQRISGPVNIGGFEAYQSIMLVKGQA